MGSNPILSAISGTYTHSHSCKSERFERERLGNELTAAGEEWGNGPHVHFVGFRDDRYSAAVRAFGEPDFIHVGWDKRALREIGEGDTVVFADGPHDQQPRTRSFPDIYDGSEVGGRPRHLREGGGL